MTGFALQKFGGIAPRVAPKALADFMAVIATNCRLDRSVIEPLNAPKLVQGAGVSAMSLYQYQGAWLTSSETVEYVGSLLPGDARDTLYYTDDVYPKIRSGASIFRLGIPVPATPNVTASTAGSDSRAYVVTYVDDWGFEGPPSAPTPVISVEDGAPVTMTLPLFPTGSYNFNVAARVRVYRVNTGYSGAVYQYVGEMGSGFFGWPVHTETVLDAALQEELPSAEWIGPPDDDVATYPDGPLQGLTSLSNGALCGYVKNTLFFSEPYLPHAWPMKYRIGGEGNITAIAETQQGVVVGTDKGAWLAVGAHPESMARQKIGIQQACVAQRSMVDMGDYAIYASPDGLVRLAGGDAALVTESFFSRDEWQTFSPTTIRAFLYEGLYVGFYGPVSDATGFIFDPRGKEAAFIRLEGMAVVHGVTDATDGTAYVLYDEQGSRRIGAFNQGSTPLLYTWRSKEFIATQRAALSVARVEATSYPVEFQAIADGRIRFTRSVKDAEPFRLPSRGKAKTWQFEVAGASPVVFFGVWNSMKEVV